ncbi:MAG: inner membrane CreD family protein [Burkholderiales bacterium]
MRRSQIRNTFAKKNAALAIALAHTPRISSPLQLIALYVHAVLQSAGRAVAFAGMLTALYTMLYALLRSEDHGLLLGALLVFCVLAAVMLLTRRVDWYSIGGKVTIAGASS